MNEEYEYSDRVGQKNFGLRAGNGQLLLIALLVAMLFTGPTILLKQIDPTANWQFLPVVVALVAVEGAWTTRWLCRAPRNLNRSIYRLAEALSLVVGLTLIYWLSMNSDLRGRMVENLLESPLSIYDTKLIVIIVLCLLAWEWSNQLAGIFSKLALSQDEITFFTTSSSERLEKGIAPVVPVYRNQLYHSFIHLWAIGGLLLALFAMLATVELTNTNLEAIQTFDFRIVTRLGLPPELLMALIVYFGAGFWLASHARLAVMQARWVAGGIEFDPAITTKWRQQVLFIIFVVGLVAAFLPIGSTFAISEIIQALLGYMIAALTFLFGLVPFFLAWLLSLFSSSSPRPVTLPADELTPIAPNIESSESLFLIPPAIFEGLFIASAVIIALLALVYFLRYRSLNIDLTRLSAIWSGFLSQLPTLWQRLSKRSSSLAGAIRSRLEAASLPERDNIGPWRFLPIQDKSARERIRYYYLSIIYRAEKLGVSRSPGETPLEYEKNLINRWPEARSEISDLTALFLEARYSRQSMTVESTHEAKNLFQRLRVVFRKRKNPSSLPLDSFPESPDSS